MSDRTPAMNLRAWLIATEAQMRRNRTTVSLTEKNRAELVGFYSGYAAALREVQARLPKKGRAARKP